MRFAARTEFGTEPSAYGAALAQARTKESFADLTVSNPTRCGFDLNAELLQPLLKERGLVYEADPLGMSSAREVISQTYRDDYAADITPDNILLTASTSETYSYLLRLFCEPGDAILVPSPSYPLFDLLARLHDVDVITYPLVYHDGWQIDPASLHAAITERTRAIVTIHPNNPTGHFCSAADRNTLLQCAVEHDLPLIVDEVFLQYNVEARASQSFASSQWGTDPDSSVLATAVLTFVLGGLSKSVCLPQMKLAWTLVCGPRDKTHDAMDRLEVIADTFLSVGTPPQLALSEWLSSGPSKRGEVLKRVHANLAWLDRALSGSTITRLQVEAGWVVILRIPANDTDTEVAILLLQEQGVALHPGSLYGFQPRGWLVASLLTPEATFRRGIAHLLDVV